MPPPRRRRDHLGTLYLPSRDTVSEGGGRDGQTWPVRKEGANMVGLGLEHGKTQGIGGDRG